MSAPVDTQPSPVGEPQPRGSAGWRVAGILGEILITVGVFLLLMVVYELWWTNVEAEQEAEQQREQLVATWEAAEEPSAATVETPPIPAEAFGLMYIPRLEDDVWGTPLIHGVSDEDLTKGIGHFPETALPGAVGNSSYAGHRSTHGEPLARVDLLQEGDAVYVETATAWHTYRLTHDQLVLPTDVWVVDPVPGEPPGTVPVDPVMTLVTCHPRWGSTERWIWWGSLEATTSKDDGPPAEIAALLAEEG